MTAAAVFDTSAFPGFDVSGFDVQRPSSKPLSFDLAMELSSASKILHDAADRAGEERRFELAKRLRSIVAELGDVLDGAP